MQRVRAYRFRTWSVLVAQIKLMARTLSSGAIRPHAVLAKWHVLRMGYQPALALLEQREDWQVLASPQAAVNVTTEAQEEPVTVALIAGEVEEVRQGPSAWEGMAALLARLTFEQEVVVAPEEERVVSTVSLLP